MKTKTRLIDVDISWLRSWVAWRNIYTTPHEKPFDLLKASDLEHDEEGCLLCKGMLVVNDPTLGVIYCMCQVKDWAKRVGDKYSEIRTLEVDAKLSDLDLHPGLGEKGIETLGKTIVKAENFIKAPFKWLVISGPYGVGKTHILRAINTALSPICVYISSADIEDMIHKYRKQDELGDLYDYLRSAPILLIDDLGIEYGGPLFRSMMDRVIDGRLKRFPDKPTVIATNIATKDLGGYIERTGDRLMDLSKVERAFIAAKSYRKIKPSVR